MPILETVSSLVDAPRPELTVEQLEDALDVAMRGDPDGGNRWIQVLRSFRAPAPIASVEVRVPLRGATRKGPLCIIELRTGETSAGADAPAVEDVARVFGAPTSRMLPRAGAKSREAFLVYDRPWGALRFGVTTPATDASAARALPSLTTIVIDIER